MTCQDYVLCMAVIELVGDFLKILNEDNVKWRKQLIIIFASILVVEIPTYVFTLNCCFILFLLSFAVAYVEYKFVKTHDMSSQSSMDQVWTVRGFIVSFFLFIFALLALFGEIS